MAITIASTSQYIYKRNFNENKWASVGVRACKVQVIEKSGEFYFKINDDMQKTEYHLSQDSKLHYSKGFVQVPIAESKELFGIKFGDANQAEWFYGKVVDKMGQAWCDQKTGMGPDNMPRPYSMFPQARNPPPVAPSQGLSTWSPSAQRKHPAPSDNIRVPPGERNDFSQQPQPLRAGQGGDMRGLGLGSYGGSGRDAPDMDVNAVYGGGRRGGAGGGVGGAGGEYGHRGSPGGGYEGNQGGGYHSGGQGERFGGHGRVSNEPRGRDDRGGGYQVYAKPQPQHGPPRGPSQGPAHDPYDSPQGHGPLYAPSPYGGPQRDDHQRRRAWEQPPNQNPRPLQHPQQSRPPIPFKTEDVGTLVNTLMGAINKQDKETAAQYLTSLLASEFMPGSISMQFKKPVPQKEEQTFVLHIKVEFQQPEKKPVLIFLDVHESDTIDELKNLVQVKFFIPKGSQHWIIGDSLISSTDHNKTLKDFKVTGEFISEVKVFMYVQHARKANVPKEEFEFIHDRQMQQKRQQQGQGQGTPEFMSLPSQNNFGPQQVDGYPSSQPDPRGNHDVLSNRGYTGVPPHPQYHQPPQGVLNHQQQYAQRDPEPMYSQINMHGAGPGVHNDLLTRNPPPVGNTRMGSEQLISRGAARGNDMTSFAPVPTKNRMRDPSPPRHQDDIQSVLGIPTQLQHPSMAAEPVKEEKVGWVCAGCTWFNAPRRPSCEMCLSDRPEDYMVPEDAPLDEATRKAQESEMMLQKYLQQEKEEEAKKAEENYRKYLDTDAEVAVFNTEPFECLICYVPVEAGEGVVLRGCLHEFCKDCLRGSVVNSTDPEVKCPFDNNDYKCGSVISEREIRAVVSEEELQALYRKGLRQAENAAANSFHCRTNNCEGFCFYEDDINEFNCPICNKKNCLLCKAIHEDMNCQEYQDDLKRRAANDEAAQQTQKMLEELVENGEAMYCPQCKVMVQKKIGCDWIKCSMCATELCWATKGRRWGPGGTGDTTGGCKCRVGGQKCHPKCGNCH